MRDYYPRNVPWSLVAAVWKTLGQAVEVYSASFSGYTVAWVDPMQGNILVCSSFKGSELKVQTYLFFSLPFPIVCQHLFRFVNPPLSSFLPILYLWNALFANLFAPSFPNSPDPKERLRHMLSCLQEKDEATVHEEARWLPDPHRPGEMWVR